jgi:hypothetical protein
MIKTRLYVPVIILFFSLTSRGFAQVSLPYSDDFEGANAGWTVDSVSGSTWELGTPTTAPTNSTHSGVNAWDVDLFNIYLGNTESYLISPLFDFSQPAFFNSTLSFWQNRSTEAGWDGARLDYSLNGGTSWSVLGAVGSSGAVNWYNAGGLGSSGLSGWDGNSNGWVKSSFPLAIFNGLGNVTFRFAFTSDPGAGVAGFTMDDFAINVPAINDAGISAIVDPNATSTALSLSPVNVLVKNFGQNLIFSFPVSYSLNGAPPVTVTFQDTIAPGASDTLNMGNIIVPSGAYNLCVYTELPNDGDGSNDTLCTTLTSVPQGISVGLFDSLGFVMCINPPVNDQVYVYGTAQLNTGDTININIAFGDGSDTTFITSVLNGGVFEASVLHTYSFIGQFSLQAIAWSNTGLSDTTASYNQLIIGDTCGNISGKIYLDINANCIYDGGDQVLNGIPVYLMQGAAVVHTYYTTSTGDYYFVVPQAVTYDITVDTSNSGIMAYCPPSGTITGVTEPSAGNNIGFSPGTGYDLEPFMNPFIVRANANSQFYLSIGNNSFIPTAGDLMLVIDTGMFQFVNSFPSVSQVNGDTLTWNSATIGNNYLYNMQWITLTLAPNATLVLGDTICFTVIASPDSADLNPANNIKTVCGVVVNSYDPNNKMVDPAGNGPGGNMNPQTDPLTYTINFQNTGTNIAYNVYLLDTIDADLDIASLRVLGSSHPVTTTVIASDVVKFGFDNIFLSDSTTDEQGSHGFVSYTISPKAGLPDGTQITNTGYIYFDFNPAIVTNTTTNTIDYTLGINDPGASVQLVIYPNPASDHVTIITGDNIQGDIIVTDISGRKLLVQKVQQRQEQVNVKDLNSGIYFVTLRTKNEQITRKVVVVK